MKTTKILYDVRTEIVPLLDARYIRTYTLKAPSRKDAIAQVHAIVENDPDCVQCIVHSAYPHDRRYGG